MRRPSGDDADADDDARATYAEAEGAAATRAAADMLRDDRHTAPREPRICCRRRWA